MIVSFAAQWDALSPLHVGNKGHWTYWGSLIGGGFLNQPGPCGLPNTAACLPGLLGLPPGRPATTIHRAGAPLMCGAPVRSLRARHGP